MKKQLKCYIYTRVSTSMQVDGYSLDAQKDKLHKYADYQDMIIAGEYSDEGKSGKSVEGRPQFQQMLQDIETGKDNVDFVLVFKLSRFGRNAADVLSSLQRMQDFGVNTVPSLDTPTAEQPLQTEITVSSEGAANTAGLTWKKDDTEVTGDAQWKTTYQAYVKLTAAEGYTFIDAAGVMANATLNGSAVDSNKITLNNDGTQMMIDCGTYTTATRKTTGAEAPEVPEQFANYYTADNVLSSTELGKAAKVTLEGTTQPNQEEMKVEWAIVDAEGNAATYNATPTAANTFKWTVKATEYVDYNKDNAVLEGTVTIKNKDYTPVTISGSDKTLTYDGSDTLDVSQYFTIDENAGTPTYELSDNSTGIGTLDGATLTMTTLGTFVVKVSTSINGVYNKGEHTLTIAVNKATPYIKTPPTAAAITYGDTLAKATLTGGSVQYSSADDTAVDGTFAWKADTTKPAFADSGKTAYKVVFTPTNTNYNKVETDITVIVNKAENAPNKPSSTMNVANSCTKVSDVNLPTGWAWQDADKDKALTVGTPAPATAVYTGADKGNYEIESVEISITRLSYTHDFSAKNGICINCGYECDHAGGYENDACKTCGKAQSVTFDTHSITLADEIGVNFMMILPTAAKTQDAYMEFSISGKNGKTIKVPYSEELVMSDGRYKFTCPVNAIQMADTITATYHFGENETVTEKYSVKKYIEAIVASDAMDEETKQLAKSLADYGYYAQLCLSEANGWTIGTDHEQMIHYNDAVDTAVDLSAYAYSQTGEVRGITSVNKSLMLDSKTAIRLLFTLADTYVKEPVITVKDAKGNMVETQLTKQSDGRYCLLIPGISAHKLGERYTIEVDGTMTIQMSALTYAHGVLQSAAMKPATKKAVAALNAYYNAALAYNK